MEPFTTCLLPIYYLSTTRRYSSWSITTMITVQAFDLPGNVTRSLGKGTEAIPSLADILLAEQLAAHQPPRAFSQPGYNPC